MSERRDPPDEIYVFVCPRCGEMLDWHDSNCDLCKYTPSIKERISVRYLRARPAAELVDEWLDIRSHYTSIPGSEIRQDLLDFAEHLNEAPGPSAEVIHGDDGEVRIIISDSVSVDDKGSYFMDFTALDRALEELYGDDDETA